MEEGLVHEDFDFSFGNEGEVGHEGEGVAQGGGVLEFSLDVAGYMGVVDFEGFLALQE